jgi:hypothetical protein
MKMIVEVNVFVMPRHFDRFGGLTGSVVEYVTCILFVGGVIQGGLFQLIDTADYKSCQAIVIPKATVSFSVLTLAVQVDQPVRR